jgi:uncharacterized protein DUF4232
VSDMNDEIRDLLGRKADEVPPHRNVPRSLMRRVRRRIALNALAAGTVVVVLAAGAFASVRALNASGPSVPNEPPPTSSVRPTPSASPSIQPTPSASPTPACTSAQVRAVASMEGAAGSLEGVIGLTNLSDRTCTLQGTPAITLLDQNLDPIGSGVTFGSSPAGWMADGSPEPPGWPVVMIEPGGSASVRIRWSNWCPDGRDAPLWRIEVSGGGTVDVYGLDAVTPPPCNGPGQPSTIEVGPFEPGPAA